MHPIDRPFVKRELDPRQAIRDRALAIGFDAVGFCRAHLAPEAREHLEAFLGAGYHGEMNWLGSRVEERSNPQSLWGAARSAIVVGFSYAPADDPLEILSRRDRGAISVYARNRDYHDIIKGKLKHLAQFVAARFDCEVKVFVDTAPVMEKPLAHSGGLGWQGKHTNLVSRSHGSWLFLGEIYTSLELTSDQIASDHCGSCSSVPPRPFRLPISLMRSAASHTLRSSTEDRYQPSSDRLWAIGYMAVTTAWLFAPGTDLLDQHLISK